MRGTWIEGTVVNTPRLAYEAFESDYQQMPQNQVDERSVFARLALDSLNLPNERWLKFGHTVTVEHYSLFNVFDTAPRGDAWWMAEMVADPDIGVFEPQKSIWQASMVEVGATVLFVGGRAGFNPLEAFDWLAGWFGFDPAGDDGRKPYYRMTSVARDER